MKVPGRGWGGWGQHAQHGNSKNVGLVVGGGKYELVGGGRGGEFSTEGGRDGTG